MARRKRGLTCWRGGRGRSRLVSFETWHDTNEDSPIGGEEEGGMGCELQSMARHKQGLTRWREGRGRSGLVSFEMRHDTNEDSPTGGRKREERVGSV